MAADNELSELRAALYGAMITYRYSYNFTWLGRPIIQLPQDIVAVQEIIYKVKPDVIIETGIAHGGSLILSASLLELLGVDGVVVGIDIDIREHNRKALEAHPLFKRIKMIEGSSTDQEVVAQVRGLCSSERKTMVMLDSDHTHDHVRQELELYSPFVSRGSYLIVFDTLIEDVPDDFFKDRPWGKGNNPKTAVREFLKSNGRFEIDRELEEKLLFSVAPEGYLKCIKD
jgi:cephalosporin hydroxylase